MIDSYLRAEVSASALRHNLSLLRGCLAPGVKLCAVVKCDGYGHGLRIVLPAIVDHVDHLAVATLQEAVEIREMGCDKPLLAFFSPCAQGTASARHEALCELISRSIALTVVAMEDVAAIAAAARSAGRMADVHVKIDSGMTRSGVSAADAPALADAIRRAPGLRLAGAFTHMATADEHDKAYARRQVEAFGQAIAACRFGPETLLHMANSAGIIDLPESHFRMVRAGVALYGYQPSHEMHRRLDLRPAMRVTGRLMQIRSAAPGTRIGYGLTHEFSRPSTVGLVPIGYGDGYFRNLSNRAVMRVGGCVAPITGRVSMDQISIDLTQCPQARVGDEVEIISPRPEDPHSVEGLARLAGTIAYEITCHLGRRVIRVAVE